MCKKIWLPRTMTFFYYFNGRSVNFAFLEKSGFCCFVKGEVHSPGYGNLVGTVFMPRILHKMLFYIFRNLKLEGWFGWR